MDEDVWSPNKMFLRRKSLTLLKPVPRDSFQNRSLQDFSDQIQAKTEDEAAELCNRRPSVFNSGVGAPEKEMAASTSSESISVIDEWKQVMGGRVGRRAVHTLIIFVVICLLKAQLIHAVLIQFFFFSLLFYLSFFLVLIHLTSIVHMIRTLSSPSDTEVRASLISVL